MSSLKELLGGPMGIWDGVSTHALPWLPLCDLGMSPSLQVWMRFVPWQTAGDQLGLPRVYCSWPYSERTLNTPTEVPHAHDYSCTSHDIEEIKTTWMSINRQMSGEKVVYIHNGIVFSYRKDVIEACVCVCFLDMASA
jgi:hypothetical protein